MHHCCKLACTDTRRCVAHRHACHCSCTLAKMPCSLQTCMTSSYTKLQNALEKMMNTVRSMHLTHCPPSARMYLWTCTVMKCKHHHNASATGVLVTFLCSWDQKCQYTHAITGTVICRRAQMACHACCRRSCSLNARLSRALAEQPDRCWQPDSEAGHVAPQECAKPHICPSCHLSCARASAEQPC